MSVFNIRVYGALATLIVFAFTLPQSCGTLGVIPNVTEMPDIFQSAQYGLANQETWNRIYDTPGDEDGLGIVFDDDKSIYVVGSVQDDALILKYDEEGTMAWNRTWGGAGEDYARRVIVDSSGSLYAVGNTSSYGRGGNDGLLLKYSSDGDMLWYRTWGNFANDTGNGIALTSEGLVLVCGTVHIPGGNETDPIVVCFSGDGALMWNTSWGESYEYEAWDIVCGNNSLYVSGSVRPSISEDRDLQLTSLWTNGTLRWTREWSRYGEDVGYALDITKSGTIAVTGYSESQESEPGVNVSVPYLEYTEDGELAVDGNLEIFAVDAVGDAVVLDMSLSENDHRYVIGKTSSGFFVQATKPGGEEFGIVGFGIQAKGESVSSIALGPNVTMAFTGTSSLSFSTDFVFIEHFDWMWAMPYPEYNNYDELWGYSSDGVVTPLGVARFTPDSTKSVIMRMYTIESEWIEIVHDGSLLWSFTPEEASSSLRAEAHQLDTDIYSELIVQYYKRDDNSTVVVALDHSGNRMWNWTGILTSPELHVSDMNGDSLSEVALESLAGALLLSPQGSEIWVRNNSDSACYRVHGFGDYNLDGQSDIILSQASSNQSEPWVNCSVVSYEGDVLVRFPVPWVGKDEETRAAHDAVRIDAISVLGSASPEFYCAAVVNRTEVSEFVLDHEGHNIVWGVSWTSGSNLSAYDKAEVRFCDLNRDSAYEILRKSSHGSTYALRGDGTVIWRTYLEQMLGSMHSTDVVSLVDLEDTGVYSIMTGNISGEVIAIDPLSGDVAFIDSIYIPDWHVGLCANIDTDPIAEYVFYVLNRIAVLRHLGDWRDTYTIPDYALSYLTVVLGLPIMLAVTVLLWVRKAANYRQQSSYDLESEGQLLALARRSTIAT